MYQNSVSVLLPSASRSLVPKLSLCFTTLSFPITCTKTQSLFYNPELPDHLYQNSVSVLLPSASRSLVPKLSLCFTTLSFPITCTKTQSLFYNPELPDHLYQNSVSVLLPSASRSLVPKHSLCIINLNFPSNAESTDSRETIHYFSVDRLTLKNSLERNNSHLQMFYLGNFCVCKRGTNDMQLEFLMKYLKYYVRNLHVMFNDSWFETSSGR